MLKTTGSSNKPTLGRNNDSRLTSNRNNNSKPAFEKNNNDSELDGFGGCDVEPTKKLGKSKS